MAEISFNNEADNRHSDDMKDIITTVPSWLLRWGITLFFCLLLLGIGLSAFIRYPDIVKASLKINSPDAPKPIVAKISGKLVKLLVSENQQVKAGQPLAYLESTADHQKILMLLNILKQLQQQISQNKPLADLTINQVENTQLGELQSAYQSFTQEYLAYRSTIDNGFLLKKKGYLQRDLSYITKQQQQLEAEKTLQQKDYGLAGEEFEMHKKLAQQKVETKAELRQEESKYLAKQSPLLQIESAISTGENIYAAKQKEILELDNDVMQEKSKFLQALNSLISAADDWKNKYILTASVNGKVSFQGIIQENEVLQSGQDVFYVNPGNEQFYGDMSIPQMNIGKVKIGEKVLVKLKGYPYEQYGMINGTIKHIADIPYNDSIFMSRVDFKIINSSDLKKPIQLKQGMTADAEIITQDASILQRIIWSLFKMNH